MMINKIFRNSRCYAIICFLLTTNATITAQDWGVCYANIDCPEGIGWEKVARSVVRIHIPGGGVCSGTLLNNTAQDNTLYVITAGHCLTGVLDSDDYRVDFNYQVGCGDNTILEYHTIDKGSVVVYDDTIDIGLLKMEGELPEELNVYFAGWDLSLLESSKPHALIHHISGYPKSIAIAPEGRTYEKSSSYNPTPRGNYYSEKFYTNGWSVGDMGGGSSGAGLFYDDQYYIGTLNGPKTGTENITCTGNGANIPEVIRYTPTGHVWENDIIEISNLKTYLDPINSGVQLLDGKEGITPSLSVSTLAFNNPNSIQVYPNPITDENTKLVIDNKGLNDLDYQLLSFSGKSIASGILKNKVAIETNSLPSGMYFVTIMEKGNKQQIQKIIKM